MLLAGAFEHSIDLELAFAALENRGIPRKQILVIPMDLKPGPSVFSTSKSGDLRTKAVETGIACATASSVVGTSVGFVLVPGPIFCGLIAAFAGFGIGYAIYMLTNRNTYRQLPRKLPEIIVMVQCDENQSGWVKETLWQYGALTVGQAPEPS